MDQLALTALAIGGLLAFDTLAPPELRKQTLPPPPTANPSAGGIALVDYLLAHPVDGVPWPTELRSLGPVSGHFKMQAALVAKHGAVPQQLQRVALPKMTARQAEAWIDLWIDAYNVARVVDDASAIDLKMSSCIGPGAAHLTPSYLDAARQRISPAAAGGWGSLGLPPLPARHCAGAIDDAHEEDQSKWHLSSVGVAVVKLLDHRAEIGVWSWWDKDRQLDAQRIADLFRFSSAFANELDSATYNSPVLRSSTYESDPDIVDWWSKAPGKAADAVRSWAADAIGDAAAAVLGSPYLWAAVLAAVAWKVYR